MTDVSHLAQRVAAEHMRAASRPEQPNPRAPYAVLVGVLTMASTVVAFLDLYLLAQGLN
jgi:hypothetical protein